MKPPARVAIIGTGLIGASLGLALRRLAPAPRVTGFDVDRERLREALRVRALDFGAATVQDAVDGAELVVIATPVRAVREVLREVGHLLPEAAVVTDTASTKAQVLEWGRQLLPPRVAFVGGHPMAGKLTAQVEGPDAALFAGAVYCLTPEATTPPEAVERAVWLVEAVQAEPYFLDAAEHDALVAAVSHLPYLLAAALMHHVGTDEAWREMSALAAGGLAAATQLVDGEPRMFADICLTNGDHLVPQLDRFIARLQALRDEIADGDERLLDRFETARRLRLEWLEGRARRQASHVAEELRPANPFVPARWERLLRGRSTRDR